MEKLFDSNKNKNFKKQKKIKKLKNNDEIIKGAKFRYLN